MAEWQNLQYHSKLKQENIEEFYLLRYNAVQSAESQPTFGGTPCKQTACHLLSLLFLAWVIL
jgi:hypothetical protein